MVPGYENEIKLRLVMAPCESKCLGSDFIEKEYM